MLQTTKYMATPELYARVAEPAIVAAAPLTPSLTGAKLAAMSIVGWSRIPYEIQKPPRVGKISSLRHNKSAGLTEGAEDTGWEGISHHPFHYARKV